MHVIASQSLSWADRIGLLCAVIGAVGGAVASVIAAWHGNRNYNQLRPPSNGVTNGTLTENTAYGLHLLAGVVADALGKDLHMPTPAETAAGTNPYPERVAPAPPASAVTPPPRTPPAPAP